MEKINFTFLVFFQIHEKSFSSHSHSGALEEAGSFVIDKYVGRDTAFDVFTMNKDHGFIKSITVQDRRGRQYREIVYEMAPYHIYSAYRVPFQEVSERASERQFEFPANPRFLKTVFPES